MTAGPDNSALQVFYGTLPLVGAILLAHWNNMRNLGDLGKRIDDLGVALNKRIDDLNAALSKRIDDLNTTFSKRSDDVVLSVTNGFRDVNGRLDRLDVRVSDLEKTTRLVRS